MAIPDALTSRIAPQAWPFTGALLAAGSIAAWFGGAWFAGGFALLAAGNLAFFRNPKRSAPGDERQVVCPADGRVVEVVRIADPDGFVGSGWRIAIFLSIFNVHINFAPISGKVRGVRRTGAKYLAAFAKDASELNVQSRIDLETPTGLRLGVVQITGLIARRIVSYPSEGETLERGEPYGLICYGSRMEIYLPDSAEVRVAPGDRVRGCSSVLAEVAP